MPISDTGMATIGMIAVRQDCRKTMMTMTTSSDRLDDRLVDLVDRFGDELGRVVDDVVGRGPGGKSADSSSIVAWISLGRGQRVGAGPLEDAERHRRLAVEIGVGDVVLGAELDARDVLQLDQAAVLAST